MVYPSCTDKLLFTAIHSHKKAIKYTGTILLQRKDNNEDMMSHILLILNTFHQPYNCNKSTRTGFMFKFNICPSIYYIHFKCNKINHYSIFVIRNYMPMNLIEIHGISQKQNQEEKNPLCIHSKSSFNRVSLNLCYCSYVHSSLYLLGMGC